MAYLLDLEKMAVYVIDDNLEDENGNTIYDITNREVPNEIVGGLKNLADNVISAYPLVHGIDIDQPSGAHHTKTTTLEDLTDVLNVSEIKVDTSANLTAGTADRLCIETDTGRVLYDDGTSFIEMGLSESQISLANLSSHAHSDLSDSPVNAHIDALSDIPTMALDQDLVDDKGQTIYDYINQEFLNAVIPNLDASKITSGELGDARIPDVESLSYTNAFATGQIPDVESLNSVITGDQVLVGDGAGGLTTADYIEPADIRNVTSQSAAYTASEGDIVLADASGGAITITLPTPSKSDVFIDVKKTSGSGNTVTIDAEGTETIDGASTKMIDTQYESLSFVTDGTDWYIV